MDIYGHIYQPLVAGGEGLRRFGDLRKMTPLDVLNMYTVNLVICCRLEASLDVFFKKLAFCSNDYASWTHMEILCTKTCCVAGGVQSKYGFGIQTYHSNV